VIKEVQNLVGYLINPPYLYGWIILVTLLLILYTVQVYRRSHRPIIPFKAQGGTVEIAPSTLKGIINQTVQGIEGIERAGCKHRSKGNRLAINVGIHLQSHVKLKTIEAAIKGRIRAVLSEQFGIENVDPIHIRVNKVIGTTPALDTLPDSSNQTVLELEDDSHAARESDDDRPYADELNKS